MIRLPTDLNEVVKQGGTVVVPSRQRAHAARLAHAAAELAKGRGVWATPDILPVEAWLTREIERYAATAGTDVPRLLSPAEEWFLWRQCAAEATGELELVNRGALAEALRRASAIAADYRINVRGASGSRTIGAVSTRSIASESEPGSESESESESESGPESEPESGSESESESESEFESEPGSASASGPAARSLSDSILEDVPGTEAALLAEVQRAVDERCQSLGAAAVASLTERLRSGIDSRLRHGEEPRVVGSGFLTIPPRLRSLVSHSREMDAVAAVAPNAIMAADELDELERIAQWCKQHIEGNPDARILIMLPGAPGTRERLATLIRQAVRPGAWFRTEGNAADSLVVIEGGVPLARVPAVAHALATLSWLGGNAGDFEAVSGWLRSPYWQTPGPLPRARLDLWLRERERMHFDLHELVGALSAAPSTLASVARDISGQINKAAVALRQGSASPRDWSERFRAALKVFDWPGERARGSGEQQTVVRFHELLDEFGQLASAARSISRDSAIQWFTELAIRTAFRPADDDAVITISSTLADPVVRYDAIWVAGLHAEAFPQPVQPDPFIPLAAQLAAGVPAASASGRLAEARALISAWRAGADELVLSAPARSDDLELLPSPLLAEWLTDADDSQRHAGSPLSATDSDSSAAGDSERRGAGPPGAGPPGAGPPGAGPPGAGSPDATPPGAGPPGASGPGASPLRTGPHGASSPGASPPRASSLGALTSGTTEPIASIWLPIRVHREGMLETFEDTVGPAWPIDKPLPSGTRSLELQNQCPFRAYAELRLGSTPLDAPEPGIAADLRGQLLHAALQKLWGRLRDSRGLASLSESALDAAIQRSVEEAADETVRRSSSNKRQVTALNDMQGDLFGDPERSPALSRECRRATRLIRALCAVERERAPFRVESTELDSTLTLMGAQLRIRIDRVDALESGGRAILDYKSGRRTTADWYGERPSHPQLLAYLAALGEDVVAMATVNVTAREVRFDGIANSAELLPKVRGVEGAFGTDPLDAWPIRRQEWLSRVEHLAADFLAGRAVVDPKPGACDYCHVASICRISDRVAATGNDAPVSEATHE